MPRAYAPPPAAPRGFPYPSNAFAVHGLRLAPSRAFPDRIPAPPGGRAHVTEDPRDLDIEQGVLRALEVLARGRELTDELGQPISPYEKERHAGLRASGLAGVQARLRPHLRRDHPWTAQAQDLVDRLAVEERYWWGVSGRRQA
ncbi:MAG: hypothetical protein WAP03_22570 [Methylorubrum rhodinum]|uniref:hypothetical protein n=1 Tax=Methylorubrum rhodinum TaxID=29428 RepID=UPI003BB001AA